jgi:DNA-binding GntR family transcriptional regulator
MDSDMASVADLTGEGDGKATVEGVVAALRHDVVEGRLLPGARLRDQQLAARFGVSRNTLRDALRLLAVEGLVVSRHNAGSEVRRLQPEDVRDIYTARRVIECSAVVSSATAHERSLEAVDRAASAAERAVQRGEWTRAGTASLAFHQSLADLIASQRLSAFFGTIVAQLRLAFAEMEDEAVFQASWIPRDRQIADHVLSGRRDTAAVELQRYLDDSEAMVLDVVHSARHRSVASDRGKAS